jgi:hypothetical protein
MNLKNSLLNNSCGSIHVCNNRSTMVWLNLYVVVIWFFSVTHVFNFLEKLEIKEPLILIFGRCWNQITFSFGLFEIFQNWKTFLFWLFKNPWKNRLEWTSPHDCTSWLFCPLDGLDDSPLFHSPLYFMLTNILPQSIFFGY